MRLSLELQRYNRKERIKKLKDESPWLKNYKFDSLRRKKENFLKK